MTSRTLPVEDWHRLSGTELATVYPHLNPETAQIIVVEDGDQIVACWALLRVFHVEGVWIHPAYQKRGTVARKLLRAMRAACQAVGAYRVATSAVTDDVVRLIRGLHGAKLPGDHYVISMEGR